MEMSCRLAGDNRAHQKRPVKDDGLCDTCWNARRRRRRSQGRLSTVRRSYGLSEDDLIALVAAQHGRCWICRRRVGVVKAGAVDHDHRLGNIRAAVRGILCSTCNRWLGHVGDDPAAGIRAAFYLIDPPAPKVLTEMDRLAMMDRSARGTAIT